MFSRVRNLRTSRSFQVFLAGGWVLATASGYGCGGSPSDTSSNVSAEGVPKSDRPGLSDGYGEALFADRSELLPFVHWNGMSGEYLFPEMTGGAVALVDIDLDGDLDIVLPQGAELLQTPAEPIFPPPSEPPLRAILFRNRWNETGELGFERAELAADPAGYSMGVAAADYDNDGDVDLYLTNFGANQLLRNLGDGTFEDATAAAGVDDDRWSVPAVFLDYDRDGWLDLFVGNYVDYTVATNKRCRSASGGLDYCGPHSYPAVGDRLFRNRGDGTFEVATERAGLTGAHGAALGAVAADFDRDGWIDLYVANDGTENQLWINRGDGTFEDRALLSGAALNAAGDPEAGMGVSAGDYDNDGDEDLFVAHLTQETSTLYRNDGVGGFGDTTVGAGLGQPTWQATGFGTGWFDYDNDGWLDLVTVNGAVKVVEALARKGDPYPLHQTNQLFRNRGDGRFEETTKAAGPAFAHSAVSRGVAFGDLDNDGDVDLVVANNAGPAQLIENRSTATDWLGLRLVDRDGRSAEGAWVELIVGEEVVRGRRVSRAGSYAAASDPRVVFGGLADVGAADLRVRWVDGTVERFELPELGCYTTLERGPGDAG